MLRSLDHVITRFGSGELLETLQKIRNDLPRRPAARLVQNFYKPLQTCVTRWLDDSDRNLVSTDNRKWEQTKSANWRFMNAS